MLRKLPIDRQRWLTASPYLDQALDLPQEQLEDFLRKLESSHPLVAADVRRLIGLQSERAFASFLSGQVADFMLRRNH
jgi:hypothetical protein